MYIINLKMAQVQCVRLGRHAKKMTKCASRESTQVYRDPTCGVITSTLLALVRINHIAVIEAAEL